GAGVPAQLVQRPARRREELGPRRRRELRPELCAADDWSREPERHRDRDRRVRLGPPRTLRAAAGRCLGPGPRLDQRDVPERDAARATAPAEPRRRRAGGRNRPEVRGMTGLGHVAVITDTGRRRRRNEDAYVCEPPLFAI